MENNKNKLSSLEKTSVGFGYNPLENVNHFFVVIDKNINRNIHVYERYSWNEEEQQIYDSDVLKVLLPGYKWRLVESAISKEFNKRLKLNGFNPGKFSYGGVAVEKYYGKELVILLWAISQVIPCCVREVITNWQGLQPEERWWLYTMTNAKYGTVYRGNYGWRRALVYALCDNPIFESDYR